MTSLAGISATECLIAQIAERKALDSSGYSHFTSAPIQSNVIYLLFRDARVHYFKEKKRTVIFF